MADVFEPEVRSYVMSKIRKTDTKPEIAVRKHLFKHGFRYRLYYKGLPGNPDIVLPKYNTVIFVNGCFWHAHEGCKYNRPPKATKTIGFRKFNVQWSETEKTRKRFLS